MLKPVLKVKNLHLIFCLVLFSVILFPLSSQAQSLKQQEASTAIIGQLFQGKYEFNTKATRQMSQKDILELIDQNSQVSTDVEQQLVTELALDQGDIDWRGVLAELILDCGAIQVAIIGVMDTGSRESTYIVIPLPPDNSCSKLLDGLAEYLYGGIIAGTNEVKRCESYQCVTIPNSRGMTQCLRTITLTDAERACYSVQDCTTSDDCSQNEKAELLIYDVVFMTDK